MSYGRYDRQMRIRGWDQGRLLRAPLSVVGDERIAEPIAMCIAGLGIGHPVFYGMRSIAEMPFAHIPYRGDAELRVHGLADFVRTTNPDINPLGIGWKIEWPYSTSIISKEDIVVEVSSSLQSKELLAERWNSILVAANDHSCAIGKRPLEMLANEEIRTQSPISSFIGAALAMEEARRRIMPLEKDVPLEEFLYDELSPDRLSASQGVEAGVPRLRKKRALVVGAGATGCVVAPLLAHYGIGRLYIVDDDTIEATNWNRQILYAYGRFLLEPKARVLGIIIKQMFPDVEVIPYVERVNEPFLKERGKKIDIIMCCVDNYVTRKLVNDFSIENGIPLVDGGTSPWGGQVCAYLPGQTACLECSIGIEKLASWEKEMGERAQHCPQQPEASVITSNMLIGALMVREALSSLDPDSYGIPASFIAYDWRSKEKLGVRRDLKCSHE